MKKHRMGMRGTITNRAIHYTVAIVVILILGCYPAFASVNNYLTLTTGEDLFSIVSDGHATPLVIGSDDYPGVSMAVLNLSADIKKVTGIEPELVRDIIPKKDLIILIGSLAKNKSIMELADEGKLDVTDIKGRREAFLITTVDNPFQGVAKALVITGSDMRGVIYGIYDLAEKAGVSPWYWWADVPVKQHEELYVRPGKYFDYPKVRYRGIFLNDEAPALKGWADEKFGGFNHVFYGHVFELILRLKGNFLWPAMWGSAFYDDDPQNPVLANDMGVVMGTSHHEPLMRAHDEWRRYGKGPWNYELNPENLQAFWRESIRERGKYEAVITVGMRGDGDEAMTEGTAIALLERIIEDQRQILKEEMGKDPADIPQAWALYKEVQDYYDEGMQVPDDITLLLCDDNWGNVRRLPLPGTPLRKGSYGMYYHYDFVGGPVSYRWLNVNPISRTWEQMNLSWEHGVDRIWIVNVGDLKPMEFPIDFFLDQAWNPDEFPPERLPVYTRQWAEEQFGPEFAEEIAELLTAYTRYNYRRTPEMLTPKTYSLINFREAERVVGEYNALLVEAKKLENQMPEEYRDAFYQLVTHPIEACANLNEMYYATGLNHLYAAQKRSATNGMARKVEELFANDKAITLYYHTELADGKWNHFMSQTHIGYTSWNNPPVNILPKLEEIRVPDKASMALSVEGTEEWWPDSKETAHLPEFDINNPITHYFEIYNRGSEPFAYSVSSDQDWVELSSSEGVVGDQERISVNVDWNTLPQGIHQAFLTIHGEKQQEIELRITARNDRRPPKGFSGFVEANGYIAIEAEHFQNKIETNDMKWVVIPDFGRTLSGVTVFPTTHPKVDPGNDNPRLEYNVDLFSTGKVKVNIYIAPSLNIYNGEGMQFATSFDDGEPLICRIHEFDTIPDWKYPAYWNNSVTDNIRILTMEHTISEAGPHVLNFWMVTPGVVLEKIVIETAEIGYTYLGPPESPYRE